MKRVSFIISVEDVSDPRRIEALGTTHQEAITQRIEELDDLYVPTDAVITTPLMVNEATMMLFTQIEADDRQGKA